MHSDISPNRSDSEPVTPSTPNPFARQSPSSASASESNSQNPFGRVRNSVVGSAVPASTVPEGIANSTKMRIPSRGHKRITSNDSGGGSFSKAANNGYNSIDTRKSNAGHVRSNSMQQESARDGENGPVPTCPHEYNYSGASTERQWTVVPRDTRGIFRSRSCLRRGQGLADSLAQAS